MIGQSVKHKRKNIEGIVENEILGEMQKTYVVNTNKGVKFISENDVFVNYIYDKEQKAKPLPVQKVKKYAWREFVKKETEVVNVEELKEEPKRKKQKMKLKDSIRQIILERDGYLCLECGVGENLEVHHVLYRSCGGKDTEDNLITLCAKCHIKKHIDEPVAKLMMKRLVEVIQH